MKEKNYIDISRSLACLLVIAAHSIAILDSSLAFMKSAFVYISNLATLGVFIFFFISGYVFYYNKRGIGDFIKRKCKSLILPWLFCEATLFLYFYIRKPTGHFVSDGAKFIFGYGSYLWYMSVLTALLLLFILFVRVKYFEFICLGLGLIFTFFNPLHFLSNDFNLYYSINGVWLFTFSLGLICNKYNLIREKLAIFKRLTIPSAIAFLIAFILDAVNNDILYYWNKPYLPICILFGIFLLGIIQFIPRTIIPLSNYISRLSFSIYLLHMPISGIVSNLCNRFDRGATIFIRPLIVFTLCTLAITLFTKLTRLTKTERFLNPLIGLR